MMDRQFLLQTLYNNLEDKSRVLLNKKVIKVDHSDQGVSVQCRDGTTYAGNVVIGADGVYSTVRNEMWRHMDNDHPGMAAKERKCKSERHLFELH